MENTANAETNNGSSPEIGINIQVTEDQIGEALKQINGKTALEIARMLAIEQQTAKAYKELSGRDPLTGLLNRRGLESEFARVKGILERDVNEGGEGLTRYTSVMFDLVGVKTVNDTEGQAAGDKYIKDTSSAISATIRGGTDVAARTGGDEFVLILPNTDLTGATEVVRRIQDKMPINRQFNVVIGSFEGAQELAASIDIIGESLHNAKEIAPKDETGRSLGFGVVYIGDNKE